MRCPECNQEIIGHCGNCKHFIGQVFGWCEINIQKNLLWECWEGDVCINGRYELDDE